MTRTHRLLATALAGLVALIAVCSHPAWAGSDSIHLKYRIRPQTAYDQKLTMRMTLDMEVEGVPAETASMTQALGQGMEQEIVMEMVMDVGAEGDDGAMPVEFRMEGLRTSMTVAGQVVEVPTADMAGKTLVRGRMTRLGKMVEMETEGANQLPPGMVDRLLEFMPAMPDREMSVSDSFQVPMRMSIPLPSFFNDTATTEIYTLTGVSAGEANFEVRQTYSLGAAGEVMESMSMKMAGSGLGTAIFDLEEGIFSRIKVDVNLEASIKGDAGAAGDGGAGEGAAAALRVKISAVGPIEMVLSRRGSDR
jgi:hypothetical protein